MISGLSLNAKQVDTSEVYNIEKIDDEEALRTYDIAWEHINENINNNKLYYYNAIYNENLGNENEIISKIQEEQRMIEIKNETEEEKKVASKKEEAEIKAEEKKRKAEEEQRKAEEERKKAEELQANLENSSYWDANLDGTIDYYRREDLAIAAGIDANNFEYVDYIIQRESGWNYMSAGNGVYGLPQASATNFLPSDFFTSPASQLEWANNYAYLRYGSWANAYEHFLIYNSW